MLILVIGDIIGKPGRRAVERLLLDLRKLYGLNMVIANGENAAGGFGLTPSIAQELLSSGVDIITSGNHIWAQREIYPILNSDLPLLRPLNYPPGAPGRGHLVRGPVMVVNLLGRTFLGVSLDCPFQAMDRLLAGLVTKPPVIIVDFHAEATSEKAAMGWYLDGRVSAVVGTHTHVGTVDTRILPGGTAFVSDIGMVGPADAVIGFHTEEVLQRFLSGMPNRLTVSEGRAVFNSVLLDIDKKTGRAQSIQRLDRELAEE